MNSSTRTIALRELLETYLESRRPQVHPIMTDHVQKTLVAFETALGVRVPQSYEDVPDGAGPLFMLFRATVESLLSLRTPLSNFLEAGLIITRLEAAGNGGASPSVTMNEVRATGLYPGGSHGEAAVTRLVPRFC